MLAAASQYADFEQQSAEILAPEEDGAFVEYNLDCSKIRNTFAIKQQPWRASVAGYVKQYYAEALVEEEDLGESYRHRDATA